MKTMKYTTKHLTYVWEKELQAYIIYENLGKFVIAVYHGGENLGLHPRIADNTKEYVYYEELKKIMEDLYNERQF